MEILPGFEVNGLSLYLKKEKTLVISDIHIGLEEAMNRQGVLIPRFQLKRVLEELERVIGQTRPERIVIAGDLKHEFGGISEQEWRDTLKVLDFLAKDAREVVLIKGNHDTILGPIAEKRNIKVLDFLRIGEVYITHGDKIPKRDNKGFQDSKIVIIGHEHPAVSIREKSRAELFKCFLVGKYGRKSLIVMPSMNFVAEGTDILREELLSPFLEDIGDFRVLVTSDEPYETYDFGKVREILRRA
jgi:putative SbcD/Mre11-related phosphoesterase